MDTRFTHSARAALAVAGLALAGGSQPSDVLVVGQPGGSYASLQQAVDDAADGDILLVRAGTYAGPVVVDGKGLTIIADHPAVAVVLGGVVLQNTAPGQGIVLERVHASGVGDFSPGLTIRQCQGPVRVVGGEYRGDHGYNPYPEPPDSHPDGWAGVYVSNSDNVSLSDVLAVGGSGGEVWDWWAQYPTGSGAAGVFVRSTRVAVSNSDLRGGHGGSCYDVANLDGGEGGDGIYSTGGTVHASGTTLTGGIGGSGGDAGAFGGGGCGGRGGDGIQIEGPTAKGTFLDDHFAPGPGGSAGWYATYCSGQASSGSAMLALAGATTSTLAGEHRGFSIVSPAREGDAPTMTFQGEPGDEARLYYSDETRFFFVPSLHGVILTKAPPFGTAIPLGVIGATGSLQVPWHVVRELGPGVDGVVRHVQGWLTDAQGAVFLADYGSLVLLDRSF